MTATYSAAVQHSLRFRPVSNRYPRRVAEAYAGDLERAAADTDDQVAATVATWERAAGVPARDWRRIGADEHTDRDPREDHTMTSHPGRVVLDDSGELAMDTPQDARRGYAAALRLAANQLDREDAPAEAATLRRFADEADQR